MFDFNKTPSTKEWQKWSVEKREDEINNFLKLSGIENLILDKTYDNGHVVFRITKNIPVKERSNFLLKLEMDIKTKIDEAITVWCSAQGDKNKLRNLRGVEIKTKK